jgi:hypothetical protein
MSIEPGIVSYLKSLAPVYPVHLPERRGRPAITYRLISEVGGQDQDGPDGLLAPRYQLTAHGDDHPSAVTLARQIRTALDGFEGELGAGVVVDNVEIANVFEIGFSDETESWQIAVDAIFHHEET